MPDSATSVISITPPLTLDNVKDGPELRTIELIHLRADGEPFPVEPWTANAIDARDSGMNYRPEFIAAELQQVVDYYIDREFTGFIEVRNSSPSQAPVARYYVRGRRVETVTPTLVWPGEDSAHPAKVLTDPQEYDCLCHCSTVHPRSLGICVGTAEGLTVTHEYLPACRACWHAASVASGSQPIGGV